jgi:hypothetical protein
VSVRDADLPTLGAMLGAALAPGIAQNMRAMRHLRIATADRRLPV